MQAASTHEEGAPAAPYLEFFDILAPIDVPIPWMNQEKILTFHLLTGEEEKRLIQRRDKEPANTRLLHEGFLRIAMSLLAVDGRPCTNMTLDQKLEWIGTWPGPLLDAALIRYDVATTIPLLELQDILSDPNLEAAHGESGFISEVAATSPENNFPREPGRSPLRTLLRT